MKKIMNQYKGNVLKAMMMLFAMSFRAGRHCYTCLLVPLTTILSSPSSEDDNPRILNTDLADSKQLDRKTKL